MIFQCQNCKTKIIVPDKVAKVKGDEISVIFCPICDYPEAMNVTDNRVPCPIVENCIGVDCASRFDCIHVSSKN